jgi:hypothetical protein
MFSQLYTYQAVLTAHGDRLYSTGMPFPNLLPLQHESQSCMQKSDDMTDHMADNEKHDNIVNQVYTSLLPQRGPTSNTFREDWAPACHRCQHNSTSRPRAKVHRTLSFDNFQYGRLLGSCLGSIDGFTPSSHTSQVNPHFPLLATISTLQHAKSHFRTYLGKSIGTHDSWPIPYHHTQGRVVTREISCQKMFVNWFFTLAPDYPRTIPVILCVTISGRVKEMTRRKREPILQNVRKNRVAHDVK